MPLAVIGAGFGRTGTSSLKSALEQLGLGPCFHMSEFFRSPQSDALKARWTKVAFDPGPPDWEAVFAGYRSTVDWPSTAFWRELADAWPEAPVILTLRDPDDWYESCRATIFAGSTSDDSLSGRTDEWGRMVRELIGRRTFDGRTGDRDHAIAVYRAHNDAVRRSIPAKRLLVYESGEGWEPLCAFLGLPVPATPYPRSNTREEFQARVAEEKRKAAGGGSA
ncbi:MAG TPA: sulfotransferase [Bauldia sp.]|mgnify:CR=1 FL=1|nr:sulfotransferase [Bauldia sp.]